LGGESEKWDNLGHFVTLGFGKGLLGLGLEDLFPVYAGVARVGSVGATE
jgi:hypothetical protein